MSQTKHTPIPWEARKGDTFHEDRPWGVVKALTLEQCREIDGDEAEVGSRTTVIAELCGPADIAEADAKFIVLACNCHEDLLEACEAMLEAQSARRHPLGAPDEGIATLCAAAASKARAAIGKARAGP